MWQINLSSFFMIFSFTLLRRKVKVSLIAELLLLMFSFYLWWEVDVIALKYAGSLVFFFSSPSSLLILRISYDFDSLGFISSIYSSSPLNILVCSLIAWRQFTSDISLAIVTGFLGLILIFFTFYLFFSLKLVWVELNCSICSLLFLLHLFRCSFSRIIWR